VPSFGLINASLSEIAIRCHPVHQGTPRIDHKRNKEVPKMPKVKDDNHFYNRQNSAILAHFTL